MEWSRECAKTDMIALTSVAHHHRFPVVVCEAHGCSVRSSRIPCFSLQGVKVGSHHSSNFFVSSHRNETEGHLKIASSAIGTGRAPPSYNPFALEPSVDQIWVPLARWLLGMVVDWYPCSCLRCPSIVFHYADVHTHP